MKVIFCALFVVVSSYDAPLGKDGVVVDLPEVAYAKLDHYEKLAKAGGAVPRLEKRLYGYHDYEHKDDGLRYHGPPAPLNHDGTVADTPDVRELKQIRVETLAKAFAKAHSTHYVQKREALNDDGLKEIQLNYMRAVAEALARVPENEISSDVSNDFRRMKRSAQEYYEDYRYHGPPAPLNHDGTVADTPEVAHLKAERIAQLQHAFAIAPKGPPLNHEGSVDHLPEVKHATAAHLEALYEAYAKAPKVPEEYHTIRKREDYEIEYEPVQLNQDGTVAETPEVLQLREAHLAAVADAFAKASKGAPLKPDGRVDDTPEVKHLKNVRIHALIDAYARAPQVNHEEELYKRKGQVTN